MRDLVTGSLRSQFFATRSVSRDVVVPEDPDLGLIAFASPHDPEPSIRVEDGRVVEIDGTGEADFDLIDAFLAAHGIDPLIAEEAMAIDDLSWARMITGTDVPRADVLRLVDGATPAKIARVLSLLNPLELMQSMAKMRARRTPSIQAHVTNRIDHPLLIAADAASAVALGFRELETTVPVLRDAPLVALALLIGSQVPAAGALTQCAIEERTELELGMRGLTSYAETVSVYGTERVFLDGDDTPWSKALLASSYASRGLKMRFTSGSGAEVLMGAAEGKSMLYLEARCIAVTRAAGSQGTQNGGIDGINVTGSVPNGMREILAENVLAALYGLETCTGNDTQMSASDLRRTAHTLPLLLAGSDFLFSGFGSIPTYDNAFGPSNFNAEDIDDYLMIQRDWGFEGVLRSRDDATLLPLRRRAAEACRAVLDELELLTFDDAEVERVIHAHGSLDVALEQNEDTAKAGDAIMERGITSIDVVRALSMHGFDTEAERVLEMTRQRLFGDHLQTSAIFDEDMRVLSALTDPNDYAGPGTGYRLSEGRQREIARVRQERTHAELLAEQAPHSGCVLLEDLGPAAARPRPDEVVIGISPAFGVDVWLTLSGVTVGEALRQMLAGIEEEGVTARVVRVTHSLDLGMIGWTAANLSGSGVAIGIQGKGTTLIHRADLPTLANLELLSVAPLIDAPLYRAMGRNAARHARGDRPAPVLLPESGEAMGPRYHAKVVALITRETRSLRAASPREVAVSWPS